MKPIFLFYKNLYFLRINYTFRNLFTTTLIFILPLFSYSQKEFSIWYFGYQAGLDFNSGSPISLTNGAIHTNEGCASISDTNGNLLFYTDGVYVWNKFHLQMPNGFALYGGYSSSQSASIIKRPGSSTEYYIFTLPSTGFNVGLNYSIVDMGLQSGYGDVSQKNIYVIDSVVEGGTIVPHSNGINYWLVCHQSVSDAYYSFLIDSSGISLPVISHTGFVLDDSSFDYVGCMKTSPCGDKIAYGNLGAKCFQLSNFDPASGIVTNTITLHPTCYAAISGGYGVEFSPDGTKLYATQYCGGFLSDLIQFDLSAGSAQDIDNSKVMLDADTTNALGAIQRGIDNKLYVANYYSNTLGVINFPNNTGSFCNYDSSGVVLSYGTCILGLPSYSYEICLLPHAEFTSMTSFCPGTCISFTNTSLNAPFCEWYLSGASPDTSTAINPTNICYPNPGTYSVTLIASNANGFDTLILQNYITVYPFPPPQAITQSGDTLFAIAGSASYQWYFNGNIVSGATDFFYVATANGDYNVVATDTNGCEVEAVINNVLAGLTPPLSQGEGVLFPNPVLETLTVIDPELNITAQEISIYNVMGEKIIDVSPFSFGEGPGGEAIWTMDCRPLLPGLYYLELKADEKIFRSKFVKQ